MNCQKARDLILTDQIDGELNRARQDELDKHMLSCPACREFEMSARKNLSGIFANTKNAEPPVYLWEGIKDRIAHDSARKGLASGLLTRLRDVASAIFRIPKPVMAFAATAIIIIAILVSIPAIRSRDLDNYLNEQADFMVTLGVGETNGDSVFDTNIRTGVENLL